MKTKIVIVAEAWGRREAQFRHALVGPSGRELTQQCGAANLMPYMTLVCRKCKQPTLFVSTQCQHCRELVWPNEFDLISHWTRMREEFGVHVTNVFNVQPPDVCAACGSLNIEKSFSAARGRCRDCGSRDQRANDLGFFFGTSPETPMTSWKASKRTGGSHLKAEHFHHVETLWSTLRELSPNLVIALGNAACWAILDQTKITTLRGTINWSTRLGLKVLPTFHPANVLRPTGRSMRPTVISDLIKASREVEFPEVRRPERWIEIIDPTEDGLRVGHEWFTHPAEAYACDIETHRGQISIVGFARSQRDALVIPFRVENSSTPNYWPTPELELEAWKLVIRGAQTLQPKIFQNGIYDLSYFLRMGIQPRNCLHDTMLWHHSEYPELPKSLGYLGSIYANDIAWKQMRRGATLKRDE